MRHLTVAPFCGQKLSPGWDSNLVTGKTPHSHGTKKKIKEKKQKKENTHRELLMCQ